VLGCTSEGQDANSRHWDTQAHLQLSREAVGAPHRLLLPLLHFLLPLRSFLLLGPRNREVRLQRAGAPLRQLRSFLRVRRRRVCVRGTGVGRPRRRRAVGAGRRQSLLRRGHRSERRIPLRDRLVGPGPGICHLGGHGGLVGGQVVGGSRERLVGCSQAFHFRRQLCLLRGGRLGARLGGGGARCQRLRVAAGRDGGLRGCLQTGVSRVSGVDVPRHPASFQLP